MEHCYRQHFVDVERAAARYVSGADRENVVHEVFYRLLRDDSLRSGFQGGSLGAWLHRVAQRQALDYLRAQGREIVVEPEQAKSAVDQAGPGGSSIDFEEQAIARQWVARFRAELPAKWLPVFEACFVEGLDQRSAAARLGLSRTTLAYQWLKIKWRLERVLARREAQ